MSPRYSKDPDKIKYVSLVNGRWVYRPYIPAKDREHFDVDRSGFIKPVKLGIEADPWHRIVKAHAAVVEDLYNYTNRDRFTIRWVVEKYEASSRFRELSSASQRKSKTTRKILDHEIQINGKPGCVGELFINEITHPLLRQIRDKRLEDLRSRGYDGKSQCNREIAYLSAAIQWGTEMYDQIDRNPIRGLRALKENQRDRYVTDLEYHTQIELAGQVSDYLPVVMELTYLLAARGVEVLDLEIKHTKEQDSDGSAVVKVLRRKGSKTTFIRRNIRLDDAINAAMALHKKRKISGKYLVPGVRGAKLPKSTLDEAMQRLKRLMEEQNVKSQWTNSDGVNEHESDLYWTLHDLKRKGISDSENKRIAGHKSEAMRQRYSVKTETFSAPSSFDLLPKVLPKSDRSKKD